MVRRRVLLVGDFPPPPGGIAIHVEQLYVCLAALGFEVSGIDIGRGGSSQIGVRSSRSAVEIFAAVCSAGKRGDAVHLHTSGNNGKGWTLALGVGLGAGPTASVLTVHSGLVGAFVARSAANRALASAACRAFRWVIAVSGEIRSGLIEAGVAASRIRVLPAFLPAGVRPVEPWAGLERIRALSSPLIAMAHAPSPVYGRRTAIAALAQLRQEMPSAHLLLFGPGLDEPEVKEEMRASGQEDAITLLGELTHARALAVIAIADVFLRPTLADGDALSVREALALGTRCVASNAVFRPEGVRIFAAADPGDCARALRAALKGPKPRVEAPEVLEELLDLYRPLHAVRPSPEEEAWFPRMH